MKQIINGRNLLILVLGFVSTLVSARTISDLDAVYKAGEQRTLIMQIAKDHLRMAANVGFQSARSSLESSMEVYEFNLTQLEFNAPSPAIKQRIGSLKQDWLAFRSLMEQAASESSIVALIETGDDLLAQSDLLMREWQARLPHHLGDRIDLALQQSMLSERISLFYMANYLGVKTPWISQEFDFTVMAFEAGMERLRQEPRDAAVDPLMVEQLAGNWNYAKLGLEQFSDGVFVPVVMSVTLDSMVKQTDTLASAFHIRDRIALNTGRLLADTGLAANIAQ